MFERSVQDFRKARLSALVWISSLRHSGHWTELTTCQYHFEEAADFGDLMRQWVRSGVHKIRPSAFQGQLEANRTPRMSRRIAEFLYVAVRYPHSSSGLKGKSCVCGTPLSSRIAEPLSNCCSHDPSPRESSNNSKMCVWMCVMLLCMWMCVLLSCLWWSLLSWSWSVLWLSCVCSVAVMCPLSCVQCYVPNAKVLLFIVSFWWIFHPLISFKVKSEIQKILREIIRRGPGGPQNTSTELFHIEDISKTSCWSNDENSKLQSPERNSG